VIDTLRACELITVAALFIMIFWCYVQVFVCFHCWHPVTFQSNTIFTLQYFCTYAPCFNSIHKLYGLTIIIIIQIETRNFGFTRHKENNPCIDGNQIVLNGLFPLVQFNHRDLAKYLTTHRQSSQVKSILFRYPLGA
jgi:hypothetical protein